MDYSQRGQLLSRDPLPLEMGIARLETGVLHAVGRAKMPECTGRMLEFWFGWFHTSEHYRLWHPIDHVSAKWDEHWKPGQYIGATSTVVESLDLGKSEPVMLHIKFQDPADVFGAAPWAAALESGAVSGAIAASVTFGETPVPDEHGDLIGARIIHVAYDTPVGCTLRCRFWLGHGAPASPDELREAIPDQLGIDLSQHSEIEYSNLGRFLPALYNREHPTAALMPLTL